MYYNKKEYGKYITTLSSANREELESEEPLDIKKLCANTLKKIVSKNLDVNESFLASPENTHNTREKLHNFAVLKYQSEVQLKAINILLKIDENYGEKRYADSYKNNPDTEWEKITNEDVLDWNKLEE